MKNKINIAELLKECPSGMELDCALFDGVFFEKVNSNEDLYCPILIRTKEGETWNLTNEGCWDDSPSAKCVIFPKGKTTWEGFHRPFVPGDIVIRDNSEYAFIYSGENDKYWECYCGVFCGTRDICINSKSWSDKRNSCRLATEEEKEKLFRVIKDNGYEWNSETKTLAKLFKPRFKVGDRIIGKYTKNIYTVSCITEKGYELTDGTKFDFDSEDCFIVSNKFDITTLKPFAQVLARCGTREKWRIQFFEKYDKNCKFPFICMGYNKYNQCIPYENNEYLLDTADSCDEFYKNW